MPNDPYLDAVERRRVKRLVRELDASLDADRKQGVRHKTCIVCDSRVFQANPLCGRCRRHFGPWEKWPEWLKFLKADQDKERRKSLEAARAGLVDYDEDAPEARPLEEHRAFEFVPDGFPHGTESGYVRGCRCRDCTFGHRMYRRRGREAVRMKKR